jgi:putative flippase GtrA
LANFALNRKFVFNSKVPVKWALLRYYSLAAALAFTAWLCIRFLNSYGWPVLAAKLTVESLLWLVSFSLQRLFVFAAPAEE